MFIGYGFPQDTLAVLAAHHSKSLRDLRFRDQTKSYRGLSDYSRGPPFPSSIRNLDKLFTQFPNLHSLGLRVDWTLDEELPYDLIANIVSQSRIRHLELNLPKLYRDNTASWSYPAADKNACEALAQSLDEISANLQSLYITIGNWHPHTPGWRASFFVEAYLIGERDYAGRMRFRKIRQFTDLGKSRREGDLAPRVPPWQDK
ncbi:hypothetical protein N7456_013596 [Penicillium angulare]|uniref:Uncharacterized protein n=1 Tax=Penicillium angulare TaxID=116970 RepID=A0A9W9EFN4_9EURO|nr:hypothetical protein N7456_013596 [Penicillium angulare]